MRTLAPGCAVRCCVRPAPRRLPSPRAFSAVVRILFVGSHLALQREVCSFHIFVCTVHVPGGGGGGASPVQLAVLITDDSLVKVAAEPGEEVDEVAVLANIRPMIGAARDM